MVRGRTASVSEFHWKSSPWSVIHTSIFSFRFLAGVLALAGPGFRLQAQKRRDQGWEAHPLEMVLPVRAEVNFAGLIR